MYIFYLDVIIHHDVNIHRNAIMHFYCHCAVVPSSTDAFMHLVAIVQLYYDIQSYCTHINLLLINKKHNLHSYQHEK